MNKKTQLFLIFLVVGFQSASHAQFELEVGGHYWYAKPDMKGESLENVEVRSGNLFGPYADIQVGRFSLGTSMFFGSFDWEDEISNTEFETKRADLNFRAGVAIFPKLKVFAAMKQLRLEGETEADVADEWGNLNTIKFGVENKGTLYGGGVSGRFPLARTPLFFNWSVTYLTGQMEWVFQGVNAQGAQIEDRTQYDTSVTAVRVALGYKSHSGLTFMLGYRADLAGIELGEERIHGVQATLAYAIGSNVF